LVIDRHIGLSDAKDKYHVNLSIDKFSILKCVYMNIDIYKNYNYLW